MGTAADSGAPTFCNPDAPDDRAALRVGDDTCTYGELRTRATALGAALTERVGDSGRIAVWATPTMATALAISGALAAGIAAVPLNPASGDGELAHVRADAAPDALVCARGDVVPAALAGLDRIEVDPHAGLPDGGPLPTPAADACGLIVYTSGTTGRPKGVVLSRAALAADLDALAAAWELCADDVITHGLPLFHVHGLVLGLLGPLRVGAGLHHVGKFQADAVAAALATDATVMYGVPTMYGRIAALAADDADVAAALRRARLLVSGSAGLSAATHAAIASACGRGVAERYGMTETLITCAVRADDLRRCRAGTALGVGAPLPGVDLRLVDDDGVALAAPGPDDLGIIEVRGAMCFDGYLNRPEATAEVLRDGGWLHTGDVGRIDGDGRVHIVGRSSTDLVKSGGYKIGTGEIEAVLAELAGVAEVAVTGVPDDDLGERVVAWIVPSGEVAAPTASECAAHVSTRLAAHKRPREVRYVDALPRNALGKVQKSRLRD